MNGPETPPGTPPAVMILNGSPHREGNGMAMAHALLDDLAALRGRERAGSAKILHLYDARFSPCRGCPVCGGLDACILNADGAADAMREALAADCLVLVSPVHFSSMSAPLVAFISRLQMVWRERELGNGIGCGNAIGGGCGVLLASGGAKYPGMFDPARKVAAAAFKTMNRVFPGMACAAETDAVPVMENRDARNEIRRLAEHIAS